MTGGKHFRQTLATIGIISLLFLGIAALQARIDAEMQFSGQARQELLLQSGPLLKKLSLGYDSLLADIYWTRAVQYYGGVVAAHGKNLDLLWPLLDITTTLDPHLIVAYRFGAVFLSEHSPRGLGRAYLAVELVKRGAAANPDEWRLDTDMGFLYYWFLHDYASATSAYLTAAKIPKSPYWVPIMAARMSEGGDQLGTSQLLWSQVYQTTENPTIKNQALRHLKGLKALQVEGEIDQITAEYQKRLGHPPASMKDLLDAGMIKRLPLDPDGYPYRL
ncbi:MAG: hypothetical protein ACRD4M_12660, partial [Candidatus Acidiferrales bacterium]